MYAGLCVVLILADNYVGHLGATAFAQALEKNSSLRELDLKRTTLSAHARCVHATLSPNLDNRVGVEGARLLSQALLRNCSLEKLLLKGTQGFKMQHTNVPQATRSA